MRYKDTDLLGRDHNWVRGNGLAEAPTYSRLKALAMFQSWLEAGAPACRFRGSLHGFGIAHRGHEPGRHAPLRVQADQQVGPARFMGSAGLKHPGCSLAFRGCALLLPSLLLAAATAWAGEAHEETYANRGQLIVQPFASAPFPHPARADGHKYKDKFFPANKHYSDSTVAIFIPKGFRRTEQVDFIIHFHGWNNTVAGTLKQYKLIEQLVESGRNAVLVVPEGPHNAPDSFGGKLEDPDGFRNFMDEVVTTLKQCGVFEGRNISIGNIILSGHSGGYRVMSAILDRGGLSAKVKEVWLFDALYAETDKFLAWWDQEHGRLINIYTDGGGTKDDSETMMNLLKQRGTKFLATKDTQAKMPELQANKLIFLHTDLGHNEVLEKRRNFGQFLKTSCLP